MSTVKYIDDTVKDCPPRDGDLGTCTKIDTVVIQLPDVVLNVRLQAHETARQATFHSRMIRNCVSKSLSSMQDRFGYKTLTKQLQYSMDLCQEVMLSNFTVRYTRSAKRGIKSEEQSSHLMPVT